MLDACFFGDITFFLRERRHVKCWYEGVLSVCRQFQTDVRESSWLNGFVSFSCSSRRCRSECVNSSFHFIVHFPYITLYIIPKLPYPPPGKYIDDVSPDEEPGKTGLALDAYRGSPAIL